ncbi:hypothetical protein CLAIMM_01847 [Cladophialophora immunda]|nr:hypothetical protein CLAIMM_01847 [Cladophialophora immunda]
MRKVTDEALQRLYWACRRKEDFPGNLPNESKGTVTTKDILEGLGLIGPELNDSPFEQSVKVADHISSSVMSHSLHAESTQSTTPSPSPTGSKQSDKSSSSRTVSILLPTTNWDQTQSSSGFTLPKLLNQPKNKAEGQINIGPNHLLTRPTSETNAKSNQLHVFTGASTSTSGPTYLQLQCDHFLDANLLHETTSCLRL